MSANRKIGVEVFVTAEEAKKDLDSVKDKVGEVGKEAKTSSDTATKAMEGVGSSARSNAAALGATGNAASGTSNALGQLLSRQQQLSAESQKLTQGINLLQRVMEKTPDSTGLLTTKMQELLMAKQSVTKESASVNNQLKELTGSSNNVATGFSKVTQQIRTSGTFMEGWDSVATAVVGSMGGITVGTALAVTVLGGMIPTLIGLISRKRELVSISTEEIATNQLVAQSYEGLANKTFIAARGFSAFEENASSVVEADIIGNLLAIADAQQKVEKAAAAVTYNFRQLELQQRGGLDNQGALITTTEAHTAAILKNRDVVHEQQQVLAKTLQTARIMRDVFGINNQQQVEAAARIFDTTDSLDALKRALNSDIDSLRRFADEITKSTERTFNLEQAALRLRIALAQIRAPNISIEGIQGVEGAKAALGRDLQVLEAEGIHDRRVQARALQSDIRSLIEVMKVEATMRARNEAEALKLYNTIKKNLSPATRELIDLTEASASRMSAFADKSKEAEAAARKQEAAVKALAQITAQLAQQALSAQIALDRNNFEKRRELAQLEFENRKAELATNNQLTELNLNRLRVIYLIALDQIARDELAFQRKERGEQREHLIKQREDRIKQVTEMMKAEREVLIREGRTTRFLLEQEENRAREQRRGRDSRRDAERDLDEKTAQDLERVGRAFGFASKNLELYNQQIDLLNGKLTTTEGIMLGLSLSLEQFSEDWIESGAIFQFVADGISDSLRRMIANGEDFGANMKAVFLELIASLAEYWGRLFISMGAGMLFLNPGAGLGLIAAGTALMALAGVFRGLADRSRQAARAQAGAAGGGGSAAAASGGGGRRSARPPTIIPFPTSPQNRQGGQATIVSLDRNGTRDFLDGHEVVTTSSLQGKHYNKVKKTVKRMTD